MAVIAELKRQEPVYMDMRAVEMMETVLGPERCREVMEDTCYALIDQLAACELALHEHDYVKARELASDIAGGAAQIGLDEFSMAARNVSACIEEANWPPLRAVAGRMMRLGEASLMSLLNLTEDPYA